VNHLWNGPHARVEFLVRLEGGEDDPEKRKYGKRNPEKEAEVYDIVPKLFSLYKCAIRHFLPPS
jgi:hypothetical protein